MFKVIVLCSLHPADLCTSVILDMHELTHVSSTESRTAQWILSVEVEVKQLCDWSARAEWTQGSVGQGSITKHSSSLEKAEGAS